MTQSAEQNFELAHTVRRAADSLALTCHQMLDSLANRANLDGSNIPVHDQQSETTSPAISMRA